MRKWSAFAFLGIILLAPASSAQDIFQVIRDGDVEKLKVLLESNPALAKTAHLQGPKSSEPTGVMLLDRMRQLAEAPALTIEVIQDILEVAFVRDEAASHNMVTFFAGTPRAGSQFEGFIRLVDCRVPTPQNTALSEPFVVVELEEAKGEPPTDAGRRPTRLLPSDVLVRFGQPDSFQPALPEDPESSGSYIYKLGSRSLWLSLSRQTPDEVLRISIHPLEDVR